MTHGLHALGLETGAPCPVVDPSRFEEAYIMALRTGLLMTPQGQGAPSHVMAPYRELMMRSAFLQAFSPQSDEAARAALWRMQALTNLLRDEVTSRADAPKDLFLPDPSDPSQLTVSLFLFLAAACTPITFLEPFDRALLYRYAREA